MKGYYVTRRKQPKVNTKIRQIIDIAERYSYAKGVPELSRLMRQAHILIKDRKQAILNWYITYCVIKIQKAYKGYKTRSFLLPMRKAFGSKGIAKLEAVAKGYIVMKILKLKDVQSRIKLIKDHDEQGFADDIEKN